MDSQVMTKLKQVAERTGGKLESSVKEDLTYIDCTVSKDGISLYVDVPKHQDQYYAYGLSAVGLPREIYPSNVRSGFTEQERSDEIVENIEKILTKNLEFYPHPGIFNKKRGYILIAIDGQETKIHQKGNIYKLSVTEA